MEKMKKGSLGEGKEGQPRNIGIEEKVGEAWYWKQWFKISSFEFVFFVLCTFDFVEHEFEKIAAYLVMATKTASKHLKWAQPFQHVGHLWQFVGRSSKQRLNILAHYIHIFEDIWLWLYFMARIWSPATQCGARSLWQGRAGLGQTGHFLCQHPNIPLRAKPFRWSGKTWNFYNILWDQTSIVCMFSATNISYRADRPKLCFGQTCWQDILFKKGNGTLCILNLQTDTGWPRVIPN